MQTKRAKLTPEQLKENMCNQKPIGVRTVKIIIASGHGYEYMAQKTTCECGRTTTYNRHRDHLKSKIHEKLMKII